MPHARVVHALHRVALAEFAQVEPGAEVFAFAFDQGRLDLGAEAFEDVAQAQDQAVVDGVSLGRAGEPDDRHGAPDFK